MSYTTSLLRLPQDQGLAGYLERIRQFPLLKPEEEYRLACLWVETGNREAAHALVTSHLRLVAKISLRYRGYGLSMSEVIAEGNIGLMQAVKRFDPHKGFRLATYALWWIKASIQEFVLRSWSLVKIATTAAHKKLFFGLKRAKQAIQAIDGRPLSQTQLTTLANRMGVSEGDVAYMDERLSGDLSLNSRQNTGDDEGQEWLDHIIDPGENQESLLANGQEHAFRLARLYKALDTLPERDRLIFQSRRLLEPPLTLEDLSEKLSISRERVRQIESRAFEKVKLALTSRP